MPKLLVHLAVTCITLVAKAVTQQKCVTPYCQCTKNEDGFITAKCKIKRLEGLKLYIKSPINVSSLDVSSNKISRIPSAVFIGFDNLVNLSFADNEIEIIGNQSFDGLSSLHKLDLKYNNLKVWSGNVSTQLPRLKEIVLTGNNTWLPSSNLLELPSLRIIRGVSWSQGCDDCTLVKNKSQSEIDLMKNLKKGEFFEGREGDCRAIKHVISAQLTLFARLGFFSTCFQVNSKCYNTMVKSLPIHRCWDVDNYVLNLEFIFGPIALILNVLVVFITVTTPKLYKNVAMLLVCNIAISDLSLALYAILITSIRKIPYVEFYNIMDSICPGLGFFWLLSQTVTVITLVLLTIERYLAIIFCMAPDKRMRRKIALRSIAVAWVFAVAVASLPVVGIGEYAGNTYCIPLNPRKDIPYVYEFSLGITSFAIVLYFVTIPLYLRIYLFVKRNSIAGVNRETSVARRIAVMVFCNMLFFCMPILIALLWVAFNFTKGLEAIIKEIITGVLPTICFTVNSMINPLLYAYRNETFVYSLRSWLNDIRNILQNKGRSLSLSTNPPSSQQTGTKI